MPFKSEYFLAVYLLNVTVILALVWVATGCVPAVDVAGAPCPCPEDEYICCDGKCVSANSGCASDSNTVVENAEETSMTDSATSTNTSGGDTATIATTDDSSDETKPADEDTSSGNTADSALDDTADTSTSINSTGTGSDATDSDSGTAAVTERATDSSTDDTAEVATEVKDSGDDRYGDTNSSGTVADDTGSDHGDSSTTCQTNSDCGGADEVCRTWQDAEGNISGPGICVRTCRHRSECLGNEICAPTLSNGRPLQIEYAVLACLALDVSDACLESSCTRCPEVRTGELYCATGTEKVMACAMATDPVCGLRCERLELDACIPSTCELANGDFFPSCTPLERPVFNRDICTAYPCDECALVGETRCIDGKMQSCTWFSVPEAHREDALCAGLCQVVPTGYCTSQ